MAKRGKTKDRNGIAWLRNAKVQYCHEKKRKGRVLMEANCGEESIMPPVK